MKNLFGLEQYWTIRQFHKGKVIWEVVDRPNIIPDEGEKALVDTFYRANDSLYFPVDNFYVGLYSGSVAETTTLVTIGEAPSTGDYSRQLIERSEVGWPTIEKNEGDWRVVSKTITLTASGGDIGPVDGAFLCTSASGSTTGVLIGALAMKVTRTIPAGDNIEFTVKAKMK